MRSKSQALTIDEVRARFEAWRQNRQGKSPIPDELWSATSGKPAPTFVELLTPRAISVPECTIELEGRRGTVRIQLKGASTSDLAGLSRALWEVAS